MKELTKYLGWRPSHERERVGIDLTHLGPMTPIGRKAKTRAPISEEGGDVQGRAALEPARQAYQLTAALAEKQASAPYTPLVGHGPRKHSGP